MARLRLNQWDSAIADCAACLRLAPDSMKAHYSLSQAHLALRAHDDALRHALRAHALCVKAADKSLGTITAHVLKCKKERWDEMEKRRVRATAELEAEVLELMARERAQAVREQAEDDEGGRREVDEEWRDKMARLQEVFERARPEAEKRREVPDWAIDDISFCVMVDPVIVSSLLCGVSFLDSNTSSDQDRQVVRARVHRRAPAPAAPGPAHQGTAVRVRAAAESRPQAGLRRVPAAERLGGRLVGTGAVRLFNSRL
jgi:STIP1 family protein 1